MTTLNKLVAVADELERCLTGVPRISLPRPGRRFEYLRPAGPQPEPWLGQEQISSMWQSVRLLQLGRKVSKIDGRDTESLAQLMSSSANQLFDERCGTVPISVLIRSLLRWPPPPWQDDLINAVGHIEIGAVIGGDFGQQLQQGGAQIVVSLLERSRTVAETLMT